MNYVHKKVKNHSCDVCGLSFQTNQNLKTHVKSVHENISDFKCHHCGKSFVTKANLGIHIEKIHLNSAPPKLPKSNDKTCEQCGKEFIGPKSKRDFDRHMKSHEKPKIIACDICKQTFPWKSYLEKHMRSAHKNKKF